MRRKRQKTPLIFRWQRFNNIETLKGKKVVVFCNKGVQADQAMEILKKNGVEAYDGTSWKNVKAIQDETTKKTN